jgi:uncharacterized protein (TIRG00374 family)
LKINIAASLKYLLFLSAGILLLWLSFRNYDLAVLADSMKNAHYKWIGISMVLTFFGFMSRAHRWNMLIRPMGYKPGLLNSFYSLMVGYFANFAIPRIGEITRCAMLGRKEKIPVDELIGTVIAERVIDLLSLLTLMVLLTVLQFERIGGFLYEKILHPLLEKMQSNGMVLLVFFVASLVGLGLLYRYFIHSRNDKEKGPFQKKVAGLLTNILTGLRTVSRLERPLFFWLHTVFIWSIYYTVSYLCFFCTDATSGLGMMEGLYVLVIGGLGMSAPVQGGLGAFHWIVSEGLTLYGIALQDGLVYATICHAFQSLFIVFLGGISYFILIFSSKSNDSPTK